MDDVGEASKKSLRLRLFDAATLKLTAWYTLILIVVCVSFSAVIYGVSTREFNRMPPADDGTGTSIFTQGDFQSFFHKRTESVRTTVLGNLVTINLLMIAAGTLFCFLLARWTLRPIERAMDAQGRFVSDASHELRTPLAVMQTENEVALRDKELSKKEMRALLASNLEEVEKLRALSDRLLRLSRDEAPHISTVDVELAASDALQRAIPAASRKGIAIDDQVTSTKVQSNAETLTDILSILLDNAVKYSPEKSTIVLGMKKQGRAVKLFVKDTGAGIDPNDLPHIFERFFRAEKSRTTNGHGLGLALAKSLADQIDAHIEVESKPSKGSTFTIELPTKPAK